MISDRQAIEQLLQAWAGATREGRQDDVLAHHDAAVRIFDVLPPLQYTSAATYRASWSEWQPDTLGAAEFAFEDLQITAGVDVGFAHSILQCGGTLPNGTTFHDTVRATFCLVKRDGNWRVSHQHISKPFGSP